MKNFILHLFLSYVILGCIACAGTTKDKANQSGESQSYISFTFLDSMHKEQITISDTAKNADDAIKCYYINGVKDKKQFNIDKPVYLLTLKGKHSFAGEFYLFAGGGIPMQTTTYSLLPKGHLLFDVSDKGHFYDSDLINNFQFTGLSYNPSSNSRICYLEDVMSKVTQSKGTVAITTLDLKNKWIEGTFEVKTLFQIDNLTNHLRVSDKHGITNGKFKAKIILIDASNFQNYKQAIFER